MGVASWSTPSMRSTPVAFVSSPLTGAFSMVEAECWLGVTDPSSSLPRTAMPVRLDSPTYGVAPQGSEQVNSRGAIRGARTTGREGAARTDAPPRAEAGGAGRDVEALPTFGPGETLGSADTLDGMSERFHVSEPRAETFKGFEEPVEVVLVDWR